MRLTIVRHGEQGHDLGLTDRGRFEMARLRHVVGLPKHLITSTLRRATESAAAINTDEGNYMPVSSHEELREKDGGLMAGLTDGQLEEQFPWLIEAWARGEDPRPPGGENMADVEARALPIVRAALDEYEDVLLVGHRGLNMAIIGALLHVPPGKRWLFPMDHAHMTVLESERGEFRLTAFNMPPIPIPKWYREDGFFIGSSRTQKSIVLTLAKHPDTYDFLRGLLEANGIDDPDRKLYDRTCYTTLVDEFFRFEGDTRIVITFGTSRLFVSIDETTDAIDRYLVERVAFIGPKSSS